MAARGSGHDESRLLVSEDDVKQASADCGVGVFGWLGFVILNVAMWGIIGLSSAIQWHLGFTATAAYTVVLMVMAAWLPRCGPRYLAFENILWVLACWFVFILGLYLSFNVVRPAFGEGGSRHAPFAADVDNDLTKLLPAGSGGRLRAWAEEDSMQGGVPMYTQFGGFVLFSARPARASSGASGSEPASGEDPGRVVLLRSNGTSTVELRPTLTEVFSFAESNSQLFILGRSGAGSGLWAVNRSGLAAGVASEVRRFENALGYVNLYRLMTSGGKLYFKAEYDCPDGWSKTIYVADALTHETMNLRGDSRCSDSSSAGGGTTAGDREEEQQQHRRQDEKPIATLWGVLLIADLPMLTLAALVLYKNKLPGLFMNLYIGTAMAVIILYALGPGTSHTMERFVRWFGTVYSFGALGAISLMSLFMRQLPRLLEAMKSWIVVVAGVPFFVLVQVDLDLYGSNMSASVLAWPWALYACSAGFEMLVAVAVSRSFPMMLGAASVFQIALKLSGQVAPALAALLGGGDRLENLVRLCVLALQGLCIIAAAIFYTSRREAIDSSMRLALLKLAGRTVTVQSERSADPL